MFSRKILCCYIGMLAVFHFHPGTLVHLYGKQLSIIIGFFKSFSVFIYLGGGNVDSWRKEGRLWVRNVKSWFRALRQ